MSDCLILLLYKKIVNTWKVSVYIFCNVMNMISIVCPSCSIIVNFAVEHESWNIELLVPIT
jgi:hypothetical protein